MEKLICLNCGHSFKIHQQTIDDLWFCDFEDELGQWCNCNEFYHKAAGTQEDPIEVSYDSESYRWN
jgi:hypothetical protein